MTKEFSGPCRLVRPSYLPPELWSTGPVDRLPPCVNYDVLETEVTSLADRLPQTLAELGLGNILTDLEELLDAAQHWTKMGLVTNLIYNVTVGQEQLFAFPSPQFDNLTADDTLEGPIQSLQDDIEEFPSTYPDTTAEAMPDLVQDFTELLDSFNCSTSGPNCNLTRGEEHVVGLNDRWTLVQRQGIEYEPGDMRRPIRIGRAYGLAYRGFRWIL
ncbi:PREDICTED: uncharacterized protein LOC109487575 [Branchiostoma belcheri]|uniref:Uncharacterized protein LOC109487575 n=1 Tax=Branchiostoma belcheri TaxID=7741 RepID=A0A6P5AYF5_BRABE|nr:PREDICTED: uncharacterized protein LOC109487575 [Branchiostoma belcheri]